MKDLVKTIFWAALLAILVPIIGVAQNLQVWSKILTPARGWGVGMWHKATPTTCFIHAGATTASRP